MNNVLKSIVQIIKLSLLVICLFCLQMQGQAGYLPSGFYLMHKSCKDTKGMTKEERMGELSDPKLIRKEVEGERMWN